MRSALVVLSCALLIGQISAQAKPTPKPPVKPTTPKPTPAPGALKCSVYNVTLKLTATPFNDNFQNVNSKPFTNTRIELEAGIHQVFDEYKPFAGLKVNQFVKAADGKILAIVYLDFKNNGSAHLQNLVAVLAKGKIGQLASFNKLIKAACYVVPPTPAYTCAYPCPSFCAPACGSCCNQYPAPAPVYTAPAPPVLLPPPPPPQCAPSCSHSCAPSCTPACCQTAYVGPYGKRHHAPRPNKDDIKKLKKHILKKHHKTVKAQNKHD